MEKVNSLTRCVRTTVINSQNSLLSSSFLACIILHRKRF